MFEILGVAGIAMSMLAYLPQVVHLAKEHCSAGVSSKAWAMWLISSVLIGALAVHRHDPVFILLQVSSLASAAVILILGRKYRGLVCQTHLNSMPKPWLGIDEEPQRRNPRPNRTMKLGTRRVLSAAVDRVLGEGGRAETFRVDDSHLRPAPGRRPTASCGRVDDVARSCGGTLSQRGRLPGGRR